MTASVISAEDFLRGQRDCRDGKPHKAGQSRDYDRGYSAQYAHEQNLTALGLRRKK